MAKTRMSFKDAMSLTPDDLPDGAFFAMAHEIAGMDYGDGFAEIASRKPPASGPFRCKVCKRSFVSDHAKHQHIMATGHSTKKAKVPA